MNQDAQMQAHDLQKQLEVHFSNNQLIRRMRKEFSDCKNPDFVGFFNHMGWNENFCLDALVQIALHKRADLKTMIGTLRHHFATAQHVADGLLELAKNDLFDWDPQLEIFIVKFGISEEVQHEIDKYQYPLPMVVQPQVLKNNKQSGYITTQGSVILKKNHTDDDVCLDHLNRMNRIPLSINADTVRMVQNKWKGLDKIKDGETREDFEKRKRAFDKYQRTAYEVMDIMMQCGNEFYLTHKYDKRGRTYAQGYHCNYQGTPWNKAVLEFADKEIIPC
ncbi:hypothetical protein CH29_gp14 [Achromobacter phage JWAlpha]|uniref:RNA polymerase n=1 Tax=Achromobacter phage JWAlpha TaxID=1416009 RepID=V9VCT7_9CAUD|nr:hypothetical protein CH29_gp14 [Achromobacter phage JWAlpha]AHC93967.1 hypothetical protein JJJB_0014 [Achromobacter phage JWAlpha]